MKQAVILAGGKGTRLASVLGDLPKPLVDIGGKPLLWHQFALLSVHGFTDVVLMVNYKVEQIRKWVEAVDLPLSIRLVDDGEPRGTAGAVLVALSELAPEFLVMYGDTMLNVDLGRFEAWHHAAPGTDVSLFLHPNDHPQDSDLVETDESGRILGFHPYPHPAGAWLPNLVNAALYMVRRDSLEPWTAAPTPIDFAKDLFPRMLEAGSLLRGYNSPEYIRDAGTPARLQRARNALASGAIYRASLNQPQKAVFFDRDGTLNAETGLVRHAEDLEVFDFAGSAIKGLNEAEWRTVLVTNQPTIARGEVAEAELRRIHARLETEIARDHAFLDRIYVCPHHPDRGFPGERSEFKIDCNCRKPKPGMIFEAQRDLNIDLTESWYVGDSTADLGAAASAGVSSILVQTGHGGLDGRYSYEANFTVANAAQAVAFILETYPRLAAALARIADKMAPGADWFIGGLPGIGKSTVAQVFARELRRGGRRARVIHTDRWVRGDRHFDMAGMKETLSKAASRAQKPIILSLPIERPGSDRLRRKTLEISVAPDEVLIWEGMLAIALADFFGLNVHAIQVTSDEAARQKRAIGGCRRRGFPAVRDDAELKFNLEMGHKANEHISLDDYEI